MQEKNLQASQRRFEADPLGLEHVREFLERYGYKDLRLIKSQRRHHVFRATDKQGHERFVKATNDPNEFIFLKNEVEADDFLHHLTTGLTLRIPRGSYQAFGEEAALAEYDFIEGESFANEERLLCPFTNSELENLFQFQLRKQALREQDIPAFFMQRAKTEFSDAQMVQKLEHVYLAPALGSVLTETEMQRLKEQFIATGFPRGFAHHDFVAWNMLKDREGSIVLTDPEHARWGMKWYDLSYQFLQTSILLGEPDEAKRQSAYFIRRFKEELPEEPIEREIVHSLSYWTGACAYMVSQRPQLKSRFRAILPHVLQGTIVDLLV